MTSPHHKRRRRPPPWQRRLRYIYIRFIRLRSSPEAIALGLAAGVFAGLFPLFGLQTIMGVAIASAIRGNKLIAAAGTWVSNPITYVPIYYFNFRVGAWLLARTGLAAMVPEAGAIGEIVSTSGWAAFQEFMALGLGFTATLFLGCFVVGLPSGAIAYCVGLWLARRWRRSKASGKRPTKF
ncbi:MAG: DUF2062 domain-containing protein [Elainellaceae cyanobacterium]